MGQFLGKSLTISILFWFLPWKVGAERILSSWTENTTDWALSQKETF